VVAVVEVVVVAQATQEALELLVKVLLADITLLELLVTGLEAVAVEQVQ
jgi:hypothetical protein